MVLSFRRGGLSTQLLRGKLKSHKKFKKIYAEITNVCNLRCSICPGTKRGQAFISLGSFETILGKIHPFTDHLYLHVMGEPLFHPAFPEILGLCETHGFKVNIATNGVLVGKHRDTLLNSKAVRQISFSIHCAEVQENFVMPPNYLREILEFIREGTGKTGIFFSIRVWNLKNGKKADANLMKTIENFFPVSLGMENEISKGSGITLAPNVFLNFGEEFKWPEPGSGTDPQNSAARKFCRALRDHCAILVDGTVVPCCLDRNGEIPLGNIFKSELAEIIGTDKSCGIINGFSEDRAVESLCTNCDFRRRFD